MSKRRLSKRWTIAFIAIAIVVVSVIVGGAAAARGYLADNPAACGDCHLMQPYVLSYDNSNFLDNVHSGMQQAAKCEDCHRQTILQQTGELMAFIRGVNTVPAQAPNIQSACLSCHPEQQIIDTVKTMPEFVANPGLSYHLNAEDAKACANPRAELVECQDCHKAHEAPVNYCSTCHSSNYGVPYNQASPVK